MVDVTKFLYQEALTYWNCYELLKGLQHICARKQAILTWTNIITTSPFSAWEVGSRKLRSLKQGFLEKICKRHHTAQASEDAQGPSTQEGRTCLCNRTIFVQQQPKGLCREPDIQWEDLQSDPGVICAEGSAGAHQSSTHRARP